MKTKHAARARRRRPRSLRSAALGGSLAAAALSAAVATATAAPAPGAPPKQGTLVAGRSLGGLRVGMTATQVRNAWGTDFGVCRNCRQRTWYFTYRRFQPQGAAVSFERGRVDAVWTLWSPPRWTARGGALRISAREARVTALLGALVTVPCGSYSALVRTRGDVTTAYYLFGGRLWGFGLMRSSASPCR